MSAYIFVLYIVPVAPRYAGTAVSEKRPKPSGPVGRGYDMGGGVRPSGSPSIGRKRKTMNSPGSSRIGGVVSGSSCLVDVRMP